MAPTPPIRELIGKYLDRAATDADVAELARRLREDPDAADAFARACRLDASLSKRFREEKNAGDFRAALEEAERNGQQRRRGRRRLAWAAAAAVAVLAVSLAALWAVSRSRGADVAEVVSGTVTAMGRETRRVGRGLPFEVVGSSPATLRLPDGSRATLEPTSQAVLLGQKGELREVVELAQGGGTFEVEAAERRFQVRTPAGRVTVLGTEFSVRLRPADPSEKGQKAMRLKHVLLAVAVTSGLVEVEFGGRTCRLGTGQSQVFGGERAVPANAEEVTKTDLKGSYAVNGQLHVGTFGKPEGKPLTTGHQDMKPSWSKRGDMLVFFRLVKYAPRIPDWKTAICIVKTDGTGFRKLTDGTHTDFNPTWTRDGTNLVVLNRQNRKTGGYVVMFTRHDARPGDEYPVSDTRIHTYAYSCLKDGRLLVSASRRPGYFLMTPGRNNRAKYEPLQCELAKKGRVDRISISPSETKVCFEHQRGFGEYRYPGRILYIADFDAKARTITNPKVIANEAADRDATFLYPRWTRDESAVVYHHGRGGRNQLYMYRLADGATTRVSTNPRANYMFPHGEKSPK